MISEQNLSRWLIRALWVRFGIRQFVETGTLDGHTAALAATMIPVVHTIEISRPMYDKAIPECRNAPNVTRHLGDSLEVIPRLLPGLTGPTLWYLDGHWPGGGPKLGPECPVLGELALLADRPQDVVVVDDARLFICPPGPPHDPAQWPAIDEVVAALRGDSDPGRRSVQLWIDTLIGTPYPLWRML
jgi:hypothetical protein